MSRRQSRGLTGLEISLVLAGFAVALTAALEFLRRRRAKGARMADAKNIVRRLIEEPWKGNMDVIDELIAARLHRLRPVGTRADPRPDRREDPDPAVHRRIPRRPHHRRRSDRRRRQGRIALDGPRHPDRRGGRHRPDRQGGHGVGHHDLAARERHGGRGVDDVGHAGHARAAGRGSCARSGLSENTWREVAGPLSSGPRDVCRVGRRNGEGWLPRKSLCRASSLPATCRAPTAAHRSRPRTGRSTSAIRSGCSSSGCSSSERG